jgi:hypothetical protein
MLLLTAQVADIKPCYYTVDALRRSTAAYKSSTSTNPDPITLACLQAAELGRHPRARHSRRAGRRQDPAAHSARPARPAHPLRPPLDAAPACPLAVGALVHHGARPAALHPRPRRLTATTTPASPDGHWPGRQPAHAPSLPATSPHRPAPDVQTSAPSSHSITPRAHADPPVHQPARSRSPKTETVDPGSVARLTQSGPSGPFSRRCLIQGVRRDRCRYASVQRAAVWSGSAATSACQCRCGAVAQRHGLSKIAKWPRSPDPTRRVAATSRAERFCPDRAPDHDSREKLLPNLTEVDHGWS